MEKNDYCFRFSRIYGIGSITIESLYKTFLIIMLGFYTILPNYFVLFGYSVSFLLAISIGIFNILYMVIYKNRIDRNTFIYCSVYLLLSSIGLFFHGELSSFLSLFIEYFILFITSVSILDRKKDLYFLINVLIFFCVLECITAYIHFATDFNVFSLLQSKSDDTLNISKEIQADTQYRMNLPRVEGSFRHAITFGIYVSCCSFLNLYMYDRTKKKRYIVFFIMCVFTLILTISRMPIIMFLVGFVIYLIRKGFLKGLIITVISILIMTLILFFIGLLFPNISESISSIFEFVLKVFSSDSIESMNSYQDESAFSYRMEMIRVLPSIIKENPILGIGYNGYSSPSFHFYIYGIPRTSIDNEYLFKLVTYGFVGLCGVLWRIIAPIFLNRKLKKHNNVLFFYIIIIILVYSLNLMSVAQMFEYRFFLVLFIMLFSYNKQTRSDLI